VSERSHSRDLAPDLGFLARTKGEPLQELPEPMHDGAVANRPRTEPASLPRRRRRSHRRRVLALAGLGTVLAIVAGSGRFNSFTATPSESGVPGRVVEPSTASNRRVRAHDPEKAAPVAARSRHPHILTARTVVRATLPLRNRTTVDVRQATVRTLAIGASLAVVAPAGASGVTLQGTTTTNNARAPSTTMTVPPEPRPVVTTDTTPFSLPDEPVTLLHP
jgi:hypothetical protein